MGAEDCRESRFRLADCDGAVVRQYDAPTRFEDKLAPRVDWGPLYDRYVDLSC